MNEWIIVKDLERKREREGRNQKYTRIFSFMRGRGNKRSDRFCSISQIFQYTRYTWRKFEFHLPEQETGRISGIKSSNWKRSIGGDIESWIFLPLSGNLAICHGISHVRGIGERRGGGRGEGKQDSGTAYTPCRRSAGEIKPEARLLATASRSFRVNPWASHWIELNNKLTPLRALKRYSIISHPC